MHEELLAELGFTKSEISVYFALLELGSTTTGPIIKKAGIAAGKAYIVLDRLVLKGLVTYSISAGTKHYQAKDPEQLLSYVREKEKELKEKEAELQKIIPTLKAQFEEKKYKPLAEVYEGVKGFKTLLDWELKEAKPGGCIHIMGVPRQANERFEAFLMEWNTRRMDKGVRMKIIYNHDCREFGIKRKKMKLTEVRYLKKAFETPVWIDIIEDYVITKNVHGTPICFLIRDKKSAETYKNYFEMVWKQSEK
jgi:sugar-specific transcriptional regulator TrmB